MQDENLKNEKIDEELKVDDDLEEASSKIIDGQDSQQVAEDDVTDESLVSTKKKKKKPSKKEILEMSLAEDLLDKPEAGLFNKNEEESEEDKINNSTVLETVVIEEESEREKKKRLKLIEREKKRIAKEKLKAKKHQEGPKVIVRYDTDIENGLSAEIVATRVDDGLVNKRPQGSSKSIKKIILSNTLTFFNALTFLIAGALLAIGAFKDLVFVIIVMANIIIGIIQEIRAKKTIDKLSILSAPTASVIRDGNDYEIPVGEVVLDDLLLLTTGKQICSDSIVVDGSIEVNESLLTGESDAIVKKVGDTLFSGSFVVSGNCRARIDKVGKDNYIEKLTSQAKKYVKPKSDLWRALSLIIYCMAFIIIPVGILLFYMQYFVNGIDFATTIRKTAGAMVGMIPSGLYLLTSVALAVGVVRLAQNNVLVQELYCIEMLARVNVLCLDKTGTITDGTMSVQNVVEYENVAGLSTKNVISAMLNALNEQNLTSVALEEKFGRGKRIKHTALIPFSSQRKFNAVTFEKYGTFVLGAPEFVMKENFKNIEAEVIKYASMGYRVLLLGHTKDSIIDGAISTVNLESVALILIEDNVRPDAVDTINYFKRSGVDVKVISGDNPLTVSKVSERAGIRDANKYISLDGLSDADVIRAAGKYTVFGRVSPGQKKLLVQTLKDLGNVVAMTGDGVNDILALKEADCSIAVASGSEAARNVSHLVLLDSNFSSMPKVVSEGRRVINNVSKVACLFLTKTIFSFLLALQALNSGGAYPISTSQLFMIDFLCIGAPSFFLILEPNNNQVQGKFLFNVIKGALPGAIVILILSMIVFGLRDSLEMDFTTSSTIIVVTATFTCMMVLFEVCRPFNLLRKALCGVLFTVFIFLTLFMPKFFEFSPIIGVGDYYDETIVTETIREAPTVQISEDSYYIVSGVVTNIPAPVSGNERDESYIDGYYALNGIKTFFKINTPQVVSSSSDGFYVVNGVETDLEVLEEDVFVYISSDGSVFIATAEQFNQNPEESGYKTNVNVLPTVTISSSSRLVVNGLPTSVIVDYTEIKSVALSGNNLVVNGTEVAYQIPTPVISRRAGHYVIGGESTDVPYVNDNPEIGITGNLYLMFDGVVSETNRPVTPAVDKTVEGHWIIDGMWTEYEVTGKRNKIELSAQNNFLVINGTVTNYVVEVESVRTGGNVARLPLECLLLMVLLCSVSLPLIHVIKAVVPWVKRQYRNITVLISRL